MTPFEIDPKIGRIFSLVVVAVCTAWCVFSAITASATGIAILGWACSGYGVLAALWLWQCADFGENDETE